MTSLNITSKRRGRRKKSKVALYIDLNSARDLQTILKAYKYSQEYGEVTYACLYAEEKDLSLISVMTMELEKHGIEIKVTTGPCEVTMALDIVGTAYQKEIDYIIVCTRRDVLIPAFVEIKKLGLKLIIFSPISAATTLQEISDEMKVI